MNGILSVLSFVQSHAQITCSAELTLFILNWDCVEAWGSSRVDFSGGGVGARGAQMGERGLSISSTMSPLAGLGSNVGWQGGLRSNLRGIVLLNLHPVADLLFSVEL